MGNHLQGWANVDFLNYDVAKRQRKPRSSGTGSRSMTVPFEAEYGLGNPGMEESPRPVRGSSAQDDWDVTNRLQQPRRALGRRDES